MELSEIFDKRYSVRKFSNAEIEENKLNQFVLCR